MAPATAMKNSTRAFRRSGQRRSWAKSFIHELVRSTTRLSARQAVESGGQLVEFGTDHAVVGGEDEHSQRLHHSGGEPLVAAAQRGGGAVPVGRALVSTAAGQDLHRPAEDHGLADARGVAAPRTAVLTCGQQGR
jgi:hypothetical protein